MLICPEEIPISEILVTRSLSPKNFSTIGIKNKETTLLSTFLSKSRPFNTGIEPGSFSYVNRSSTSFVRNSCIDSYNFSNQEAKEIYLNPNYNFENMLTNEDVLLCKDANIGDACLFISETEQKHAFSSGIVKLNFKNELEKFYCLAFLRDDYFYHQLDSLTPRGSTIRHSGKKFLNCRIPTIMQAQEPLLPIICSLIKNIAYAERYSALKLNDANSMISNELSALNFFYDDPCISNLLECNRVDAGFYSEVVQKAEHCVEHYPGGCSSLQDFGFNIKRGPNLAKRDLGRSIKSEEYKKNYHLLIYPSDISDNGYILKGTYIGARNPVWYLKRGDILFSAEGTVGKVFIICAENMKFITNFHGIIISPSNHKVSLRKSIILGQYLHYLRSIGYFDKVSVGGQGGSFAVNYWDKFKIPNFPSDLIDEISNLYHSGACLRPTQFCHDELSKAGVFELNQFRIQCSELLKKIVKDIKLSVTAPPEYYESYL